MKSILHVVENLFATISIVMVEFRSPTLQNLDLAERVMIMRFALLGILLYLGTLKIYKGVKVTRSPPVFQQIIMVSRRQYYPLYVDT